MCLRPKLIPNKGIFKYLALDSTDHSISYHGINGLQTTVHDFPAEIVAHKNSTYYYKILMQTLEATYMRKSDSFTDSELKEITSKTKFTTLNGTLELPAYLIAKCGHCDECVFDKCNSYINRATLEAYSCKSAFFFTLTYDDEHLPKQGLCRDDVVKFFKRFRINLQRSSDSDLNTLSFRSFYVGEYGKTTLRPHYHGILYFKDFVKPSKIYLLRQLFIDSWSNGKIFDFQLCRNIVNSSRYLTKYLFKKQPRVPDTFTPNFFQGPSKNGGLGFLINSKIVDLVTEAFIKNGQLKTQIRLDNGKVFNIILPPTLVKRVLHIKDSRSFLSIKKDLLYLRLLYNRISKEFIDGTDYDNLTPYGYESKLFTDIQNSFESCMRAYSFASCSVDFRSNCFTDSKSFFLDKINSLDFFTIIHEYDLQYQKLCALLYQTKFELLNTLYADLQHIIDYVHKGLFLTIF